MTKLIKVTCPHCGSNLTVDDGLDTFYCQYCGTKIMMDGLSEAAYKAKTKVKDMQHQEVMQDKKIDLKKFKINAENEQRDKDRKSKKHYLIFIFALFLFVFYGIPSCIHHSSNKEEAKLEKIVEEVQEDIKNEDFEDAYVKAQTIVYTSDWSSETEEKWDNVREELIKQISEAEKKATGSSTQETEKQEEKKGLFGLFG